jgi:hypothetical protein
MLHKSQQSGLDSQMCTDKQSGPEPRLHGPPSSTCLRYSVVSWRSAQQRTDVNLKRGQYRPIIRSKRCTSGYVL